MKEALVFAALERLAEKTGDTDLSEYLAHTMHHSGDFLAHIKTHTDNLKDLDAFSAKHEELTHPGRIQKSFTEAEFNAAVNAALLKAREEAEPKMSKEDFDAAVNAAVAKAMKKAPAGKEKAGE